MRCVIAGGGTGGHLFPGIAIAEAWVEREAGNEVVFIGTERGIEARVLTGGRFPLKMIPAMPIKGRSILGKLKAFWSLPKAVSEAFSILKEIQPQIVLGVGGYASGPALAAASLLRMKRAIHEQNVIPGMTNRILRRFSHRIFVSFEDTVDFFPGKKTVVTGNPVRSEIVARLREGRNAAEREKGERFILLLFGGSAGARRINEAMMASLDHLQGMKDSLRIIHQTGQDDVDIVSRRYQEKGFDAIVRPFFEDMATNYRMADLVICRSGASTISELTIGGKAAILIPYPYAAHGHQLLNAKKLTDLGAARMIRDEELSGPILAQAILRLHAHPEELRSMEEAIQKLGRPGAAQEIVDQCYQLVGRME